MVVHLRPVRAADRHHRSRQGRQHHLLHRVRRDRHGDRAERRPAAVRVRRAEPQDRAVVRVAHRRGQARRLDVRHARPGSADLLHQLRRRGLGEGVHQEGARLRRPVPRDQHRTRPRPERPDGQVRSGAGKLHLRQHLQPRRHPEELHRARGPGAGQGDRQPDLHADRAGRRGHRHQRLPPGRQLQRHRAARAVHTRALWSHDGQEDLPQQHLRGRHRPADEVLRHHPVHARQTAGPDLPLRRRGQRQRDRRHRRPGRRRQDRLPVLRLRRAAPPDRGLDAGHRRLHQQDPRRRGPVPHRIHLRQRGPADLGDAVQRRLRHHLDLLLRRHRQAARPHRDLGHGLLHGHPRHLFLRQVRQHDRARRPGADLGPAGPPGHRHRRRAQDRLPVRRRRLAADPPRGWRRRERAVPRRDRDPLEDDGEYRQDLEQPLLRGGRPGHRGSQHGDGGEHRLLPRGRLARHVLPGGGRGRPDRHQALHHAVRRAAR